MPVITIVSQCVAVILTVMTCKDVELEYYSCISSSTIILIAQLAFDRAVLSQKSIKGYVNS